MNIPRRVPRVPGVQDRLEESSQMDTVREILQRLLAAHGYRAIDTPVLESTELYLRKSGAEVASQMYTFTDPGGTRSALRPEFTASVIRTYIEHAHRLPLPVRWQYYGPVFRFGPLVDGAVRQFTQLGAEFIGSGRPRADAEMLALACQGAHQVGLRQHSLVIGHRGALHHILDRMGLSERAKIVLLNGLAQIKEGETGTAQLRSRLEDLEEPSAQVPPAIRDLLLTVDPEDARSLVQHLFSGLTDHSTGSRSVEQIVARLVAKLQGGVDHGQMERSLGLLTELCRVRAEPEQALAEGQAILRDHGLDASAFADLEETLALLQHHDLGTTRILLDFGLARGLAYYTGMIFEIHHPLLSPRLPLCGGGRYDGLVRALGGPTDIPALGFAFGVERLREAQEQEGSSIGSQEGTAMAVLVVPESETAYHQALKLADSLRLKGQPAELEVEIRTEKESLAYAQARGMSKVLVVGEGGQVQEHRVKAQGG